MLKRRLFHTLSPLQNNSLQQLHQLPTSTGAGLFVERPKFQTLGTPPTLLHVTLPSSSVLNARTKSLVAINGDASTITQKLRVLGLSSKPLVYNEVSATRPLSLLLSNPNGFINLELSSNDQWTVMNSNSIAGWYGPLYLSSSSSSNSSVQVIANDGGNLLLTGESQVFTIRLDSEESIHVNPSSLVAYTGTPVGYEKINTVELPNFGVWNTVKSYYATLLKTIGAGAKDQQEPTLELKGNEVVEAKESSAWSTAFEWFATKFNTLFFKSKLFYEIKGPATVIIQNRVQSLSKTFTQEELSQIYKSLK